MYIRALMANKGVAGTTRCRAGRQDAASRQASSRLLRCAPALRVTRPNVLTHRVFMAGSELPATSRPICENTSSPEVNPHILCSPFIRGFSQPPTGVDGKRIVAVAVAVQRSLHRRKRPVGDHFDRKLQLPSKLPAQQHGSMVGCVGKKVGRVVPALPSSSFNHSENEGGQQCLGCVEVLKDHFVQLAEVLPATKLRLMRPFPPDRKDRLCDGSAGHRPRTDSALLTMALEFVAQLLHPELQRPLPLVVGAQIAQVDRFWLFVAFVISWTTSAASSGS